MELSEWAALVSRIRALWPQAEIPDATAEVWFESVADVPAAEAKAAVDALARDGERFPPTGGMIRAKVAALGRDDIDWGEAWQLAKKAGLKGDEAEAQAWLQARSPAAAETVRRLCGPVLTYLLDEEMAVRAQFRMLYEGIVQGRTTDEAYQGLASGGLKALQRGPRQLGEALRHALPPPPPEPKPALPAPERKAAEVAEKEAIRADLAGQLAAGCSPTATQMAKASLAKLDKELAELKGQAAPDAVGDPGAGS